MYSVALNLDYLNNDNRSQHYDEQILSEDEEAPADVDRRESIQDQDNHQGTPSSQGSEIHCPRQESKHEFKCYLLDEKYEKPWIKDSRYRALRHGNWIIYICILLALVFSALLNWRIALSVPKHDYCLILDDSFTALNKDVWKHEVQVDGFGNGAFDWTTTDPKNAFTDKEGLHIVPTLTTATTSITEGQIHDKFTLDLTRNAKGDGSCTADQKSPAYKIQCVIESNSTRRTIVPPVRSARLTTRGTKSIQYGRIEVTAKLPRGDWLWPAIRMMPEDSMYGPWPLSGEIDIMESHGNARGYPGHGRELVMSTLHWGPSVESEAFWRTTHASTRKRHDYSEEFHTYGIEWSKDYLFTYLDNPLQQVLYVDFKRMGNLWTWGQFQGHSENGSTLKNPWVKSENFNAPFDQRFYLVFHVAVGSSRGGFPNAVGNKPWNDAESSAPSDFYAARHKWEPTWGKGNSRGMTIKHVKMWQEGKCKH
ncbi:concanavalin A-like lectin/glucanase [Tothia fuscella]|uniref:Concanavalin A-like lectin/glucanase n=1 Tax=Tothia fuscella TaxID=1048955 RepID=A0A9P4NMP5_9PEZI|nr:concanavalin A-like lectin/glucanase [Tothia fuscella]